MKKIMWFALLVMVGLMSACGKEPSPPVEKIPNVQTKAGDNPLLKQDTEGKTIDAVKKIQLTPSKTKEVLAIFHDEKQTYFRVYGYNEKSEKWQVLFEDYGPYKEEESYQLALTYPPLSGLATEHALIARQTGSGGFLSYFVLGEVDGNVLSVLDNDFSPDAEPVYQGDYGFDGDYLIIYSNGEVFTRYYWFSDAKEYGQTD